MTTTTQHLSIFMTTPTGSHPSHGKNAGTQSSVRNTAGRKRPTLKETQAMQAQKLSPEEAKRRQIFYQKMAYIEMKKLRPKHPHV